MSELYSDNSLVEKINKLQDDFFELNKLFDLGRIVNQASDINNLAERLLKFLDGALNLECATFFICKDKVFETIASRNTPNAVDLQFENAGEGIWRIFAEGLPVHIINSDGKNIYEDFFKKYQLQELNTHVFLPCINQGDIIAIISIGPKKNLQAFTEQDFSFLQKVINYISPIINKFKIQQEKENNLAALQKTLHNISILYNIGQAMNFIDDLKGLLKVILEEAIKTIGAEKGSLMLYDVSTNELAVKVVYGLPDKEIEDKINEGLIECTRIKVGEGIAGNVFLTKSALITNLGNNDPRFAKADNSNVASILCVPLVVKGESIGVINITNKKNGNLFNQHDLDFMEALANQAAIAIDNAQLYELATKDGLTKLYIYRHFHTLLDTELKRSSRYKHKMSLLMMDIDNFKEINDTHGHQNGDLILKEIANVITNTCRKIDMPARYGGEEFALILPETSAENARVISERIRQNIEKIKVVTKENKVIIPTISMGIAEFPSDAKTADDLIGAADKALYLAKRSGKNCVATYNQGDCFVITCSVNYSKIQEQNKEKNKNTDS